MKSLIVLGAAIGLMVLVASVLSSATDTGEPDDERSNVTGALARGAVSEATHPVNVWRKPADTFSRSDRQEQFVGRLEAGDRFRVEKHVWRRGNLWVRIVGEGGLDIEGWAISPSDDPIIANRIR